MNDCENTFSDAWGIRGECFASLVFCFSVCFLWEVEVRFLSGGYQDYGYQKLCRFSLWTYNCIECIQRLWCLFCTFSKKHSIILITTAFQYSGFLIVILCLFCICSL